MPKSPTVEDVARVAGVSRQTVSNVAELARDRQGRPPASGSVGDRRTRLPPALRGADAAHAPQLDHRHPSRSVRRRDLGRRAGPVRPRGHRAGGRAGHADARLRARTPRRRSRASPSSPRRRDRRGRHHRHVPRRSAHRLARSSAVCRSSRSAGRGAMTMSPTPLTRGWTSTGRPAPGRPPSTRSSIAGPRVAFLGWPSGSGTGDDRERGWREAMTAAGESAGPDSMAVDDVAVARRRVTAARRRSATLDALVCVSDSLAVGAHLAAVDAGIAARFPSSASTTRPSPRRSGSAASSSCPSASRRECWSC